jgi:hypothetical protein
MVLVSRAVNIFVSDTSHDPATKRRRLRDGDVLENGDVVLVRGGDLAPDILSADAVRYYRIYGTYGISVFAVRDATVDELAQHMPLVRFGREATILPWAVVAASPGQSSAGVVAFTLAVTAPPVVNCVMSTTTHVSLPPRPLPDRRERQRL